MLINGEQNIFKNLGDFFSPYMRFLQYAVFPRKLKTHKPRTKCTSAQGLFIEPLFIIKYKYVNILIYSPW